MERRVKGILFVDYVRMMRSRKKTAWSEHLEERDLPYLSEHIEHDRWYPMETYERMGLALLEEISAGELEHVHFWGRQTVASLREAYPGLFVEGDIRETLMRFQTLRASLFNYPVVVLESIRDGQARFSVDYGMSPRAEEAATHQFVGFLERTLEIAGALDVHLELAARSWHGEGETTVVARWHEARR